MLGASNTTLTIFERHGCKNFKHQGRCDRKSPLTSVEATADSGNDYLESEEGAHAEQNGTILLIDTVDTDNMNSCVG